MHQLVQIYNPLYITNRYKHFYRFIFNLNMELVELPDTYAPSIDENGNYTDKIHFKKPIMCPCGAKKDKTYETRTMFSAHVKSKTHLKWIADLNLNKSNFFAENQQLKETINNQRLIIAKMEKDIQHKIMTIDYLTLQLHKGCEEAPDLLEF